MEPYNSNTDLVIRQDPDDYTAAELAQVAGHQEIYDLLNN